MSLVGFKAQNHPQQAGKRGARPEIDNLETPWEFFKPLDERFGFTLDVAALPHNAKCERYYTPEDDGLTQDWAGERVWCNPPYSDIGPWLSKAWLGWAWADVPVPELIVMLLPANRTEQGWWQKWVEPYRDRPGSPLRVEFLKGRLRFIKHGTKKVEPNQRPPFGCCLLIWDHPASQTTGSTPSPQARSREPEPAGLTANGSQHGRSGGRKDGRRQPKEKR